MQHQFENDPLTPMNEETFFDVVDDKDDFTRVTSNDSGIDFDTSSDNESFFSDFDLNESTWEILKDVQLAAVIRDDEKKFFCENTVWAWHGEFARLIMATALTYHVDYRFLLDEDRLTCPRALQATYFHRQDQNAKAQFKCEICGYCWTSMRARCSFFISKPDEDGIILLKLYSQQCQYCYSIVSPLWYFDEICRVMKNLAKIVCELFFPQSLRSIEWNMTHDGIKPVRRLYQRAGHMRAQHNPFLCEACRYGHCYE